MRVLLVEDDPMLGNAVGQALRDASYAVDGLQDGRQRDGLRVVPLHASMD